MVRASLAVLVVIVACKAKEAPPPAKMVSSSAPSKDGTPVAKGTMRLPTVETEYGVAIAPGQELATLEKLARDKGSSFAISHKQLSDLFTDEQLQYITTDLSPADVAGLKATPGVILLHGKGTDGTKLAHSLASATAEVADAAKGWVVDPETFGIYTAKEFHDHVPGDHVDVRKVVMVHQVVGDNHQPYLDTAGMHRFGLPDLYVREVSSGEINQVTTLINGAAQVLLDGGDVDDHSQIAFDLKKFGWDLDIIEKGTGTGIWRARWAHEADGGDLVIELEPPTGPGIEEQMKLIEACFGAHPEKMAMLEANDADLLAVEKHARDDLAKLRSHFAKGIPVGEQLTIKAKFTDGTDEDAAEWMWVDVVAFKGNTFEGTLANEPDVIKSLKNGQKVKVQLADVGDYILETADGKQTGGYSIELMRKRGLIPEGE